MKLIKYFFESTIIISLFAIFKIVGLKNASNLGAILGKFIGPIFRSKKIVEQNITIGLGEIDKVQFRGLEQVRYILDGELSF